MPHATKFAPPDLLPLLVRRVADAQLIEFSAPNVTVTESDDAAYNTATYSIRLTVEPTGTVLVFFSNSITDFSSAPSVLQFRPDNWNVYQGITVQATNDNVDEETESFQLGHHLSSGDLRFNEKVEYMTVIVQDDDTGTCTG